MKAQIYITLKNGVFDPQGKAAAGTLKNLGFEGINSIRQGKYIEVDLEDNSEEAAKDKVKAMCEKLLANTVIENYEFKLVA